MTQDTPSKRRPRRMAREPQPEGAVAAPAKEPSRLDQLQDLLSRDGGTTIADMVAATGWQQHSVRGAMAGALKKKRGLIITSNKVDGLRYYHASLPS